MQIVYGARKSRLRRVAWAKGVFVRRQFHHVGDTFKLALTTLVQSNIHDAGLRCDGHYRILLRNL